MRKYFCDICGKPFTKGIKAEQGKPCTGTVGTLLSGLDICEPCLDAIRSRSGWEQTFLQKVREEIFYGQDK